MLSLLGPNIIVRAYSSLRRTSSITTCDQHCRTFSPCWCCGHAWLAMQQPGVATLPAV